MDRALYVSMTGAKYNMMTQAVHSNNLANVSTAGFKSDFIDAVSQLEKSSIPLDTRAYATARAPVTNFSLGPMAQTGRELDIVIDGAGWIAVQSPNGESYVKSAQMNVDSVGALRDSRGFQILGNAGPIVIPENEKIEIGGDGTISIRALGQGPEALVEVDRIKLVNPADTALAKQPDGLIYSATGREPVDAAVRIRQGFTEASNVNAVEELTNVVTLARQFELQVKMMQTFGDMQDSSAQLLRVQV